MKPIPERIRELAKARKAVILAHNYIPTKLLAEPYQPEDLVEPIYKYLWENGRSHLNHHARHLMPQRQRQRLHS